MPSLSVAPRRFSNNSWPDASITVRRGSASCSSSRPLQSKSGSVRERSNNPNLMLEEPEFRTRMASDMIESLTLAGDVWILAIWPGPAADFRHVFAVLSDIARMLDQGVAKLLLDVGRGNA